MGSKTKYYTDLQVNHMFDDMDNLWGTELARAASSVGSMDPKHIMPAVITDSMFFYNEAVFDKMGVDANVYMSVARLTKNGIGYYIATHVDPLIQEVTDWFYRDSDGIDVDPLILQIKDALDDYHSELGQCSVDMWQELNSDMYTVQYPSYKINDVPHIVRKRIYSNKEVPDVQFVNDKYGVWMLPVDENCVVDESSPVHVNISTDDRAVIAVEYTRTDASVHNIFLYESDITTESEAEKTLVIPFFKNAGWVEADREVDFILNRFGLGAEDDEGDSLKKSMEEAEDLKHAFVTYSLSRDDSKFGHWVEFIYGAPDGSGDTSPTTVTIQGEYNISYRMQSSTGVAAYTVTVERESKNANEGYFYIMPTSFMKKQTLPNKFNAYKYMFNMWMYAEKEVKIKWYQTMFFRIIFFFVAIIFLGPMGLGVISAQTAMVMIALQVVSVVMQYIDPRLAAILGLAFALFTFNPASLTSILSVVNNVIKTFSSFSQYAFQSSLEALGAEMEDIQEDTKELREQLNDMWHQGVWIPLHTQDYMMSQIYNGGEDYIEMSYNQSDMIEIAMENMLNPNARLV